MKSIKMKLLSTTVMPAIVGAGMVVGGALAVSGSGYAAGTKSASGGALPTAQPRPQAIQLAACKPCAAKKSCGGCNPCAAKKACGGCNPCAAKKACGGCNPCAAKKACGACNPCNPCGGGGSFSAKCVIPRLKVASACNPCAAKKACGGCNPCAAKKACGGCNPCAAKKAGGACGACGACGAGPAISISAAEAKKAYACLRADMTGGYGKAGLKMVKGYAGWTNVAAAPYQSDTHGGRYVNNYANKHAARDYSRFEKAGKMPVGSVLAKDSFAVRPDGKTGAGPLFIMEKMPGGFSKSTGNWRYSMVMPNGKVVGMTNGKGAGAVKFCNECHASVAEDQDYMFFLPEESRARN